MDLFNLPFFRSYEAQLGWLISRVKNVETSEANAKASEEAAADHAGASAGSAGLALLYRNAAKDFRDEAQGFANNAADSAESIADVVDQVDVNTSRINNLIANAGDGTIPSELVDARVEFTGFTNVTAGDAIRAADTLQTKHLLEYMHGVEDLSLDLTDGYYSSNGTFTPATGNHEVYTQAFPIIPGRAFVFTYELPENLTPWFAAAVYDGSDGFVSRIETASATGFKDVISITENGRKLMMGHFTGLPEATPAYRTGRKTVRFMWRGYTDQAAKVHIYSVPLTQNFGGTVSPYYLLNGESTGPQPLAINTSNKTVTIPGDTLLISPDITSGLGYGGRFRLSNSGSPITLNYGEVYGHIDTANYTTAVIGIYDGNTDTVRLIPFDDPDLNDPYTYVLFTIRWERNGDAVQVNTTAPYSINGEMYGISTEVSADTWRYTPAVRSVNHRGYNSVAPENTLPAFRLSKKRGFDIVECDLQLTSDHVPVVLHDRAINRTARNADGTAIANTVNITDITYAEALTYDFGIWKGQEYAGTKIPTFEEFLRCCKQNGLSAYVELKTESDWTVERCNELDALIKEAGMVENITFISAGLGPMTRIHSANPAYRIGIVTGAATINDVDNTRNISTNSFIDASSISDEVCAYAKGYGIGAELWTIDTETTMTNANAYITGFTSNYTIAAKVLYEYQQSL